MEDVLAWGLVFLLGTAFIVTMVLAVAIWALMAIYVWRGAEAILKRILERPEQRIEEDA